LRLAHGEGEELVAGPHQIAGLGAAPQHPPRGGRPHLGVAELRLGQGEGRTGLLQACGRQLRVGAPGARRLRLGESTSVLGLGGVESALGVVHARLAVEALAVQLRYPGVFAAGRLASDFRLAQLLLGHGADAGAQLLGARQRLAQGGAGLLHRGARFFVAQARQQRAGGHAITLLHGHRRDHARHLRTRLHPRGRDDTTGGRHGDRQIALHHFHHLSACTHERQPAKGKHRRHRHGDNGQPRTREAKRGEGQRAGSGGVAANKAAPGAF
jgi:hypothetical protein